MAAVEVQRTPGTRRFSAAVASLRAAVRAMAACVREADADTLGDVLIQVREAGIDPLEAVFADGVRRFDKSGEYRAEGALSLTEWLRSRCNLSGGAAAERVEVARQLEQLPQTAAAFANGDVGYQHAVVMARAAEHVGAAAVRKDEASLLQAAQTMDPGKFTGVAKNFEHRVDAAGALAEANRAYERRYLHIAEPVDGLVRLDGVLDAEGGAILRSALQPYMKPAKDDARTYGRTVPAETVQRHACDSAITRITGGGELEQELNHASRTLPAPTRRALEARDRHCVFPGCTRPLIWCDGHHLVWWTQGGATALPNLALLCRPHHRMVHEEGWRLIRHKDGRFTTIPPPRSVLPNSRSA